MTQLRFRDANGTHYEINRLKSVLVDLSTKPYPGGGRLFLAAAAAGIAAGRGAGTAGGVDMNDTTREQYK